eukprot:9014940-Pyramimonas_sp.AAC.1
MPSINFTAAADLCKHRLATLWNTLLTSWIRLREQISATKRGTKTWIAGKIPLPVSLFWSNATNALFLATHWLLPTPPPKSIDEGLEEQVDHYPTFVLWTTLLDFFVFVIYAFKNLELGIDSPEAGPDAWRYKLVGAYPGCGDLRPQIWRYVLYQFCHSGWPHIFNNVVLPLVVGCSLEGRLGSPRVALVYNSGVVAGAFACSFTDVYRTVLGASGGIYALFGLHFANILCNWVDGERVRNIRRMMLLAILMGYDLMTSAFFKADNTSYAAHAAGWGWGLLCGLVLIRNNTFERYERGLKIIALLLCGSFVVFSLFWICVHWLPANWWTEEMYGAQSDAPCCWKELPYDETERESYSCLKQCNAEGGLTHNCKYVLEFHGKD